MLVRFLVIVMAFVLQINNFVFAQSYIIEDHKATVRDFSLSYNVFPVVEEWASQNKYNLIEATDNSRTYKRGKNVLTAPSILIISQNNDIVHLESYIKIHFLARLNSLFLLPGQMSLNSGGFRAVVPRKLARGNVNQLLLKLEQEPIK